jgi:polyisoprenoid-binding protein YceI
VIKTILILGVVLVIVAVGVVAYSFLKPPEAASGPIEAIPVAVDQAAAEAAQAPATADPEPTDEVSQAAVAVTDENVEPEITNTPEAPEIPAVENTESEAVNTPTATEVPIDDSSALSETDAAPVVFEILQSDSEARFIIDEVLNGAPKTVVGATDQVAGEIAIYPDDPASSVIGPILVNARTLSTDNDFRNRAIKNRILSTDDYEFVTFTPNEITGLPERVSVGESFTFQIVGDLNVRDVTREVTFDAAVTPISEKELEGTATTIILYADFGLSIPEAPAVASVDDEVRLEIDFVAAAK